MSVASLLNSSIRDTDTLSRSGGDEFILIIENTHQLDDIALMAEKFSRIIEHRLTILDQDIHVKASIGISVYPQDGLDIGSLLGNSDAALHRAKDKGGNAYEFYSSDFGKQVRRCLELESNLRHAIENNELVVYYQPIINLNTGITSSMEALVRWKHPQQGIILPDEFISIAEETGLIIQLGNQVIESVCKQLRKWKTENIPITNISINLSSRQFIEPNLVNQLKETLEKYHLDASNIGFELTESTLLKNESQAAITLNELHKMGVIITIDDFGTGHTSLSSLKKMPINTLKIDTSFVNGILNNPDDKAIVNAIYGMAKGLGLKLVAEGIETQKQLEKIKEIGVDYGQGFLWNPATTAEQYIKLLGN